MNILELPPDLYSRNFVISLLINKLLGPNHTYILDVGGHNGKLNLFLKDHQVIVVDKKEKPEGLENEHYFKGDAKKLLFPEGSFEVVVASDLLEHVSHEDRSKIIEELFRVSKNYIIIGAPFKNKDRELAEKNVREHFLENTGKPHKFLSEHELFGLPDENQLIQMIKEKGYNYLAIPEGNLLNWLLYQASSNTDSKQLKEFYNQNFKHLGNLRYPTYRTIYCISKTKPLPEFEIKNEIEKSNQFEIEVWANLINKTFSHFNNLLKLQKVELYEKRKSQTLLLQNLQNELNSKNQKVKFLQENIKNYSDRSEYLQSTIVKKEQELKGKIDKAKAIETEIQNLEKSLNEYKKSLEEVFNSRAWKIVMIYSKIKIFIISKLKFVSKGFKILFTFGPKVFYKRFLRKVKNNNSLNSQSAYELYLETHKLNKNQLENLSKDSEGFSYKPVISIVMPVYNVEEKWLVKAIESVRNQTYGKFELCLYDDSSTQAHIKPLLQKYAEQDTRIKVRYRTKNGGIVKASNDALKLATGAYVGLLDNDDELSPNALYEVVKALQEKKYDLIYSDEDKLEMNGQHIEPLFKPDFSPDLLLSCNYISHFGVYKRKILNEIGGFREGFDGSQDYDLVLRFTEKTDLIKHIPKVLYHWRRIHGSTAEKADAKPYAYVSAKKALKDALKRRNIKAEVLDGKWLGSYQVKRELLSQPLVSIIIPFKDKQEILEACLKSIFAKTTYPNYEILLVDNQSQLFETAEYLKKIEQNPKITILKYDKKFNYSAINNFAAKKTKGEILILLNNDITVISENWIQAMLEHAERKEVGAVGAKLLYPNNTIQHAGVLIGLLGAAGHAFCGQEKDSDTYFGMMHVIRNYSAVTAACLMIRKEVYEEASGLNEQDLGVGFNDVDFCLRLREKGYLIVYTPYAELYHYESLSRGFEINLKEVAYLQRRHAGLLKNGDPYYNPNLTLERADFSLKCLDKVS